MPGYAYMLQDKEGNVSMTRILIDKVNYYPVRVIMKNYSKDNPDLIYFTDQTYYDLKFNIKLDDIREFNTSKKILEGYKITKMKPDKH